jgi:hypothetical protein
MLAKEREYISIEFRVEFGAVEAWFIGAYCRR